MRSSHGSLQREIQQTRPFRSAGQEAMLAMFRTTDVVRRWFAERLEPSGITVQQYNVLRILRGAEPEGLNTLAIAERMIERAPGITRMLDRLERKGWIRRSRGTDDRRCVAVRITPAGLDLMAGLDPMVDAADDHVDSLLSARELKQFIEMLDRIRAGHTD